MLATLAYEVFDDVASFWFCITVVSCIVIPRAIYLILSFLLSSLCSSSAKSDPAAVHNESALVACQCEDCHRKRRNVEEYESSKRFKQWFSFWNIVWLCFAIIFVFMIFNVSSFHREQMVTFDPYEILELEKDVDDLAVIKRVRKHSLLARYADAAVGLPQTQSQVSS